MFPKLVIVLFLLAIVGSLFSSMVFMLRDRSSARRTVWALTLRVALSMAMIGFLLLAVHFGWIRPHGLTR
jgi:hypothetical protein